MKVYWNRSVLTLTLIRNKFLPFGLLCFSLSLSLYIYIYIYIYHSLYLSMYICVCIYRGSLNTNSSFSLGWLHHLACSCHHHLIVWHQQDRSRWLDQAYLIILGHWKSKWTMSTYHMINIKKIFLHYLTLGWFIGFIFRIVPKSIFFAIALSLSKRIKSHPCEHSKTHSSCYLV